MGRRQPARRYARPGAAAPRQRGRPASLGPRDPETRLAPLTIAVYDLATDTERLYPEVGNYRVPHRGGVVPGTVPMRWADDGQSLYVQQWVEDAPRTDSQWYWAALDLETGVLAPAEETLDAPSYPMLEPKPVIGDSGWAFVRVDWGMVTLTAPGGETVTYGSGLPLAWMPDGRLLLVRWPDYLHRRDIGW